MKEALISIQPKWCELIASGTKTVEVRKTKPKLNTPFSVISSNPKYNSYYLENIIKTKWLKKLNEMEVL